MGGQQTAIDLKIEVFDRLRSAMRIAEAGGAAGLNSGGRPMAMGPIEKAVEHFHQEITSRADYPSTPHWQALIGQIDKYKDKLFADPITVRNPSGTRRLQPQRTNNLMERFFRDFRRGARRRSGHNSDRRSNRSRRTAGGSRLVGEGTSENPATDRTPRLPRGHLPPISESRLTHRSNGLLFP